MCEEKQQSMTDNSSNEWLSYDTNGKPVASFVPELLGWHDVYSEDGTMRGQNVVFRAILPGGNKTGEYIAKLSELDAFDWIAKDIRFRFHPDISKSRASRYLADKIRAALTIDNKKADVFQINNLGAHKYIAFVGDKESIRRMHTGAFDECVQHGTIRLRCKRG